MDRMVLDEPPGRKRGSGRRKTAEGGHLAYPADPGAQGTDDSGHPRLISWMVRANWSRTGSNAMGSGVLLTTDDDGERKPVDHCRWCSSTT